MFKGSLIPLFCPINCNKSNYIFYWFFCVLDPITRNQKPIHKCNIICHLISWQYCCVQTNTQKLRSFLQNVVHVGFIVNSGGPWYMAYLELFLRTSVLKCLRLNIQRYQMLKGHKDMEVDGMQAKKPPR